MNPIITKSELEQYTGLSIDDGLETFFETVVGGVAKYIKNVTGRNFEIPDPDSDQTRYYNGNGGIRISIDDLRELTSLVVDDVELEENVDFYLYPLNAEAEGKPYEYIELVQPSTRLNVNSRISSTAPYIFTDAQRNVVVTGKFGFTPPDDIKLVAMKICAGIIKENIADADVREVTSESLGEYNVSYTKISEVAGAVEADSMLKNYIRADGFGISSQGKQKSKTGYRLI